MDSAAARPAAGSWRATSWGSPRLSGGAYCPFDANAADALRDLLAAAAAYAAGGRAALADFSKRKGGAVALLARQIG